MKPNGYWTYEKCKEVSSYCVTKKEFRELYGSAYVKSIRNGWVDLIENLKSDKLPNGYWTYEKCKKESLKYSNKSEFQKCSSSAYNNIKKFGWLELFSHIEPLGSRFDRMVYVYEFPDRHFYVGLTYNLNRRHSSHMSDPSSSVNRHIVESKLTPILIEKSGYINVSDSIELEGFILNEYLSNGWSTLNIAKTGGIGGDTIKWDKESVRLEALKYNSLSSFQKYSKSAYNSMERSGWIDELCSHIKRKKTKDGYWNDRKLCEEESLKYKTKSEFHRNNCTAYYYSNKNNWISEFYKK